MLMLVLILFGAAAYMKLPRDLFPEVSQPALVVFTAYEGAASSEIEQTVTATLEEKLGSVTGIAGMTSVSGEERSDIALTFGWGADMDLAAMDVRAKLDEVGEDLPEDADDPIVLRTSSGAGAVMVLNISSSPAAPNPVNADDLREEVEKLIKPRLERVDGVAAVAIAGGKQYEVRVSVLPNELSAAGLSILDVREALERENIAQRGGKLRQETTQFLIRTVGSFSIDELGDLIVSRPGEPVRRLSEVAEVSSSEVEKSPESFARLKTASADESLAAVEVRILKKSGGNSVSICNEVRRVRAELLYELAKRSVPPPAEVSDEAVEMMATAIPGTPIEGTPMEPLREYLATTAPFQVVVAYDESVFIQESLEMVKGNGVQGLLLASCMLLIFLRRVQSTFIVVLSMPVSVIATFTLFYTSGISVNIFSMAGLTLAVGMVVDNAIVVTEAIFYKMAHERRVKKAISSAITEIGPAVWSSTLTTIAVFLPIVFVPGIAGQIFRDLSWVITYTLIYSILVAFTLIPMLTMQVMSVKIPLFDLLNNLIDIVLWPLVKVASVISLGYKQILKMFVNLLAARVALIGVMIFLFLIVVGKLPPTEFFPETKVESYALSARPRVGQTLDAVDEAAKRLEEAIAEVDTLESYSISVTPGEIRVIATFNKAQVMDDVVVPVTELQPVIDALDTVPALRDSILDFQLSSLNPMQSLLGTAGGIS